MICYDDYDLFQRMTVSSTKIQVWGREGGHDKLELWTKPFLREGKG